MRAQNSATPLTPIAVGTPSGPGPGASAGPSLADARIGTLLAGLGVVAFSLTFPATVWGLDSFGPWSLVAFRGVLAALLAGAFLLALRVPVPDRRHWAGLAVVGGGVVIGFPLLTTLALRTSTSAHAAVVVGLLPLTTSVFAALRTGQRPSRTYWAAALAGAAVVLAFTVQQSGGTLHTGDLYLFGALLVCAAGYTEGGRLAAVMPGWQVIGWALVLCLPLCVAGSAVAFAFEPVDLTARGLTGLLWVSAGSQFFGLYVWYRGMAGIGIARASQLQLAQPLLTLVWAVALLGEDLSPAAPPAAAAVLVCIAVTQRTAPGRRLPRGDAQGPAGRSAVDSNGPATTERDTSRRSLPMEANVGDTLLVHGRTVGDHDKSAEVLEVLGQKGSPPFRVRFDDGHEAVLSPGPDCTVQHHDKG